MFSQAQPDHYAVWCWWWNTWWCESESSHQMSTAVIIWFNCSWWESLLIEVFECTITVENVAGNLLFFFFFVFFLCCHACETEDVCVSDLAFWTDRILFAMFWLAEAAQMKRDLFCYWCWCNQRQVSLGTGPKWLTLMLCGIALQDYVDDCNRSVL